MVAVSVGARVDVDEGMRVFVGVNVGWSVADGMAVNVWTAAVWTRFSVGVAWADWQAVTNNTHTDSIEKTVVIFLEIMELNLFLIKLRKQLGPWV